MNTTDHTTERVTRLYAVADHAENHGLTDTINTVGVNPLITANVFVAPRQALLHWAATVAADTVTQTDGWFVIEGHLDDGTDVQIKTLTPHHATAVAVGGMGLAEFAHHVEAGEW